jgi:hypothetical protein
VGIKRLYIKRQNDGCGLVELESAHNVGLSKYIKQGKARLTRLEEEYARKPKYSPQKEAHLIKHKYTT